MAWPTTVPVELKPAPVAIRAGQDEPAVRTLRRLLRGALLCPGLDGYDQARRVWNAAVDRRPAFIARCAGVGDVITALTFAQEHALQVSVRGSGHSAAGHAIADGGLVIDCSSMNGIWVDPVRRVAIAQAGATWGALDHETQTFGLATTGGRISSLGVAGLTLGGGYGWLMRAIGLAVDNLRTVDVVLADGRLVTASPTEHADLFWAMRGGGGNFGIATSLEFKLYPIGPTVTGGAAFYPAERAAELLSFFRAFMATAPYELGGLFNFVVAPPAPFVPPRVRGMPVVAIAVCHAGSLDQALRDLAPLRDLGPPLIDRIRPMPYLGVQRLFDVAGEYGHRVHGRSGHLANLSDEVITTLVAHAAGMTSPHSIVMISALGGAVARVGEGDTAFSHRQTAFDYAIESVWDDPDESHRHIRWTDDFWAAMRPFDQGVYVNVLGDEGEERIREAYHPATYDRLAALKTVYDPDNLFRLNQNIPPHART